MFVLFCISYYVFFSLIRILLSYMYIYDSHHTMLYSIVIVCKFDLKMKAV